MMKNYRISCHWNSLLVIKCNFPCKSIGYKWRNNRKWKALNISNTLKYPQQKQDLYGKWQTQWCCLTADKCTNSGAGKCGKVPLSGNSQSAVQPVYQTLKRAISMTANACGTRVHHRLLRENALPDTFINRTLRKDRVESDETKERWISYLYSS